jgi:hypothetical protein
MAWFCSTAVIFFAWLNCDSATSSLKPYIPWCQPDWSNHGPGVSAWRLLTLDSEYNRNATSNVNALCSISKGCEVVLPAL